MRERLMLIFCSFYGMIAMSQNQIQYLNGVVENDATGFPMESVHVLNLNLVEGTTTDKKGKFEIRAQVNDTLYFSYLGYKSIKIAVTQDMIKFGNSNFKITQLAYALEEIILRPYQLTGFLDIDVKMYLSTLLAGTEYLEYLMQDMREETETQEQLTKLAAIFNPVDFLHNLFGKKGFKCKN